MIEYLNIAKHVLENGTRKESRTGVDTISAFNYNYQIDLRNGFPLLTTKEISWKNIVVENLWFLSGQRHIGLLRKHGCKFWDPWADEDGYVPSAYGNFWRYFPVGNGVQTVCNDQIAWVLEQIRSNPFSRRHVVTAWDPGNAQNSALPPCHAFWALNVQVDNNGAPNLCLHLTQRSADVALGVPYNIAGYSFLLELFGRLTGIRPAIFAHTLIDSHIYTAKSDGSQSEYDHVPGLQNQISRPPKKLPKLTISPDIKTLADVTAVLEMDTHEILDMFQLSGYDPHPAIQFRVAV